MSPPWSGPPGQAIVAQGNAGAAHERFGGRDVCPGCLLLKEVSIEELPAEVVQ